MPHAVGAHVIVTAASPTTSNGWRRSAGAGWKYFSGDIADLGHRQHLAGHMRRRSRLDVLVNNTGICDAASGYITGQVPVIDGGRASA